MMALQRKFRLPKELTWRAFTNIAAGTDMDGVISSPFASLEPYPKNIAYSELVMSRFDEFGDKLAITDGVGNGLTFSEISSGVNGIALAFQNDFAMKHGDKVLLYSPNDIRYFSIVHGVSRAGGVVSTCNPLYGVSELEYQLEHSDAKFLVTSVSGLETSLQAASTHGLSKDKIFIVDPHNAKNEEEIRGFSTIEQLEKTTGTLDPVTLDSLEDDFYLPYSSGTTGRPKGVQLSNFNMTSNLHQAVASEGKFFLEDEVVLSPLPSFHCYGFLMNLNLTLHLGKTLVSMPSHSIESFCSLVEEFKVTRAYIVPPIMIQLAKDPKVDEYDMSSLRHLISAAAPLGCDIEAEVEARLSNVRVKQAWGMTETSPLATMVPDDALRPRTASVGVLIPDTYARIVDPEDDSCTPLAIGEVGELQVTGPQVMKGYLNDPEKTAESFSQDGWLLTGDVAKFDDQGYLYITDRTKELIKYKGFQVAPAELEAIIITHPDVKDTAVIRRENERAGEVPRAYCVLKDGSKAGAEMEERIKSFVAEKVTNYKHLRGGVKFVDEIPKTASGKLLRRNLYEMDKELLE
eukprot:g5661.t1